MSLKNSKMENMLTEHVVEKPESYLGLKIIKIRKYLKLWSNFNKLNHT